MMYKYWLAGFQVILKSLRATIPSIITAILMA